MVRVVVTNDHVVYTANVKTAKIFNRQVAIVAITIVE
jgi:hypothetical protein